MFSKDLRSLLVIATSIAVGSFMVYSRRGGITGDSAPEVYDTAAVASNKGTLSQGQRHPSIMGPGSEPSHYRSASRTTSKAGSSSFAETAEAPVNATGKKDGQYDEMVYPYDAYYYQYGPGQFMTYPSQSLGGAPPQVIPPYAAHPLNASYPPHAHPPHAPSAHAPPHAYQKRHRSYSSLTDKEQWVTTASAISSNPKRHNRLQTDTTETVKPGDTLLQTYSALQVAMGDNKVFTQKELSDAFFNSRSNQFQGNHVHDEEAIWESTEAANCVGRYVYVREQGPPLGTIYTGSNPPTAEDCKLFGDPDTFDINTNKNGFLFAFIQSDWDKNWQPSRDPTEHCLENQALKGKGLKLYTSNQHFQLLVPTFYAVGYSYNCLGATKERTNKAPCDSESGEEITGALVIIRGSQPGSTFMSQPKDVFEEKYIECQSGETKDELKAMMERAEDTWDRGGASASQEFGEAGGEGEGKGGGGKSESKSDAHSMAMTSLVNAMIALLVTLDM